MDHTNVHDPLHVYSIRELPLTQLLVDNTIDTLHRQTYQVVLGSSPSPANVSRSSRNQIVSHAYK